MFLALLAAACVQTQTSRITVLDSNGKPSAGVEVFGTRFWFERDALAWGNTDGNGEVTGERIAADTVVLALASDGRLGETVGRNTICFGPTGTVEVRLRDGHGHPLVGLEVELFPTTATAKLAGFIVNRGMPNMPEKLKHRLTTTTDGAGLAKFIGIPSGANFSVTMSLEGGQPLVLNGSVRAGKPASVEIPLDRTLSGRYYRLKSGKPIVGANVSLVGPGYHNFMPGTVTDAKGFFKITGLPAADYSVMITDLKDPGSPDDGTFDWIAEQRDPNGGWLPAGGGRGYSLVSKSITNADFAFVRAARIKVKVVDPSGKPVKGYWVFVDAPKGGGEGRQTDAKGISRFSEAPGKYLLKAADNDNGAHATNLTPETFKEGEHRELRFVVKK